MHTFLIKYTFLVCTASSIGIREVLSSHSLPPLFFLFFSLIFFLCLSSPFSWFECQAHLLAVSIIQVAVLDPVYLEGDGGLVVEWPTLHWCVRSPLPHGSQCQTLFHKTLPV